MRTTLPGLIALILSALPAIAQTVALPLQPELILTVTRSFAGEKAGEAAEDISGIACIPGSTKVHRCLVVNDQNRNAQFADIENGQMSAGIAFDLVGTGHSDETRGPKPDVTTCPGGRKRFKDIDGEGVAYARPFFYVVGSHGCSRKDAEFRVSSFILAQVRVDPEGRIVDAAGKPVDQPGESKGIVTTYRLAGLLRKVERVGEFFGKRLQKEDGGAEPNGLNVEGIAVIGDDVFVGLRAPSLEGSAFVVTASLADLFADGPGEPKVAAKIDALALGQGMGIRDLAARGDGSLLVLAGPAQEQDLPYGFYLAQPKDGWKLTRLPTLAPVEDAKGRPVKAEGAFIIEDGDSAMKVLVVFDGLPDGGARLYRVPLR